MRTNLRVPFAEKDEAKRLGARWDATRKIWYLENVADAAPFARWMPTEENRAVPTTQGFQTEAGNRNRITGSNYVPQPRVCDCLPWDVCDKCRATALSY